MTETIKQIKHQFMTYRNGIIADTLRKAGMPHKIIFGLQLPQISSIARGLEKSDELAMKLWNDEDVRESRLLACHLFTADHISEDFAIHLAESVNTREEADYLSFRLLRNLNFAKSLATRLSNCDTPLKRYCGEALSRNIDSI